MCFRIYIRAYAFGDRYLSPVFRRAANNQFTDDLGRIFWVGGPHRQSVAYAFANIPSNRVILQRLVDDFCDGWDENYLDDYGADAMNELPPAFPRRMPQCFIERGQILARIPHKKRCYHEHESDEDKEYCKDLHMR